MAARIEVGYSNWNKTLDCFKSNHQYWSLVFSAKKSVVAAIIKSYRRRLHIIQMNVHHPDEHSEAKEPMLEVRA